MHTPQPNGPANDLPSRLAKPVQRALAAAGIQSLAQLSSHNEAEIGRLHGIGPNALDQLRRAMVEKGLSFRNETQKP